jgi:hypothetical protein
VCRSSLHEISPMALFTKLAGQQTSDSVTNPMSYVALCHYESGISRPVKQHELQFLVRRQQPALFISTAPITCLTPLLQ